MMRRFFPAKRAGSARFGAVRGELQCRKMDERSLDHVSPAQLTMVCHVGGALSLMTLRHMVEWKAFGIDLWPSYMVGEQWSFFYGE